VTKPTQAHPLEACRQKIQRSLKHLDELHATIGASIENDPYVVTFGRDAKPPWRTGHLYLKDAPTTLWGVILGDALYEMRSTLDHLVYRLSTLKENDKRRRNLQFPIFEQRNQYWEPREGANGAALPSARDTMLCGVDEAHRKVIDDVQPFEVDPKHPNLVVLARLSAMNNRDKHRLVNVTGVMISQPQIIVTPEGGNQHEIKVKKVGGKTFQPGAEIFRFRTFPDPEARVSVKTRIPLNVGFGTPPADLDFIKTAILQGVFQLVRHFEDVHFGL
jgi:hypothetical protein